MDISLLINNISKYRLHRVADSLSLSKSKVAFIITFSMFICAGCVQKGPGVFGFYPDPYIQSVVENTRIDTDWSEIIPPSPLLAVGVQQSIRLVLMDEINDINFIDHSMILADGRQITVTVEVIDDQGVTYPFTMQGLGRLGAYFYRARDLDEYVSGPDFDVERSIVKIRIKSNLPIKVKEISWVCSTPH
jgi:hypothetical protein